MKTVLITGVYGFLGSSAALKFKQEGWRILGIGRGKELPETIKTNVLDQCVTGDVTKEQLSKIEGDIDAVLHFAGNGVVSRSFEDPLKDFNDSVVSTEEALNFIRQHHPRAKFIFASGATVYGIQDDVPLYEEMPLHPASPYGVHKRIAEEICEMYSKTFNVSVSVIRFFSTYGPGLRKQLLYDACKKLTDPQTDVATFWGTGNETRDWFNINDALEFIHTLATDTSSGFSITNAGSGEKITIKETVEYIKELLASPKEIVFSGQGRTGDPQHFWADIGRAKKLGWKPEVHWQDGIAEYVEWFRQTPSVTEKEIN